jgi:hypothetical protein
VVFDEGAEFGVAVDRGPGDPGVFGDLGDCDGKLATLRQAVQTLADTVRHHDAQLRQLGRG